MSDAGGGFIVTSEYRRFSEFAEAVRRERYIGLCYGSPGVGKTLSARRYSCWDDVSAHLARRATPKANQWPPRPPPPDLASQRTIMWTPPVMVSPSRLNYELTAVLAEHWQTFGLRAPSGELISERTVAGLASARARGRKGGRPYKMTPAKLRLAGASMGKPSRVHAEDCGR